MIILTAQELKMLQLKRIENKKYTLKNLEKNVLITKQSWSEYWKVQIIDDLGYGEVQYFKTLKDAQKQISINMGVIA